MPGFRDAGTLSRAAGASAVGQRIGKNAQPACRNKTGRNRPRHERPFVLWRTLCGGLGHGPGRRQAPSLVFWPEAYFRAWCREGRRAREKPTILTGGMRSYALIEEILDGEETDIIGLSRPLIKAPGLVKRWEGDRR